jgi:hypothetical protein
MEKVGHYTSIPLFIIPTKEYNQFFEYWPGLI